MKRPRKLVIAFDFDDVLVPTADIVLDAYNKKYGTAATDLYSHDPNHWSVESIQEVAQRIDALHRQSIVKEATVDEATITEVMRIAALGHELHVVTGRHDHMKDVTSAQVEQFYPSVFTSIEHTNMYAVEGMHHLRRSKGEVCRQLGADILIDDHILHGEHVLAAGMKDVIIFGDYPWNQADPLPDGMQRCVDMKSVYEAIQDVASRK